MRTLPPLAALLLAIAIPAPARSEDGLDIYFIDVQGGAATLLVTPERESILVDSGWPGFDDRDPKRITHVLKNIAKCEHLDHLITTHWHTDHYGGVEGLAKLTQINRFWDRGLPDDNRTDLDFPDGPKPTDKLHLAYKKASEGKRTPLKPNDLLPLRGNLKAIVLTAGGHVAAFNNAAPNPTCDDAPPDLPVDHSDNARSVTLLFQLGNFEFLDCGDLTWNIEKKLVCDKNQIRAAFPPSPKNHAIDLYQVTHHGMDISNHPTLVKSIQPTVAVMNNGPRKGGSPAVVKLLKSTPSIQALYALHKNQATTPAENANAELTANTDPAGGQFIHVHVNPDGANFTVQIGTDGPKRSFNSM